MHQEKRKKEKKQKLTRKKKIILISTISVAVIVLFSISFYISSLLNKVTTVPISEDPVEIGIKPEVQQKLVEEGKADDAINIALFGLDARYSDEASRSDSIMILTVDKAHKKLKLSSIMRDSYVSIDGHGMDKITHAYAFGGPQLAVKTLNQNFDMNITGYASVDFFNMAKIIDSLGGITLDVKKDEVPIMNDYIVEMAEIKRVKPNLVSGPGKLNLTGIQAVAYARNRYSGNGDFERTDRQRRVLSALMDKIEEAGPLKYPSIVGDLLPLVQTSLSKVDILKVGTDVLTSGIKTLEQERFPLDGYCDGKIINEVWYLVTDLNATKDQIHKFIYDDVKPTPKQ